MKRNTGNYGLSFAPEDRLEEILKSELKTTDQTELRNFAVIYEIVKHRLSKEANALFHP